MKDVKSIRFGVVSVVAFVVGVLIWKISQYYQLFEPKVLDMMYALWGSVGLILLVTYLVYAWLASKTLARLHEMTSEKNGHESSANALDVKILESNDTRSNAFSRLLLNSSEKNISRLKHELKDLNSKSIQQLTIGIAVTLLGLTVLLYSIVFNNVDYSDLNNLIGFYAARISIVVFMEVFAFFFLKLYRNTLIEIKYFQNELTNIEQKLQAIQLALEVGSEADKSLVIENLVKTDRNFILEKDQSTVEIEKQKIDVITTQQITEIVNQVFNKLKS